MISRNGKENFFAAHYDWLAAVVGVLALAAGAAFFVMALGTDADEAAASEVAAVDRMKPADLGVKPVDLSGCQAASKLVRSPVVVADVSEKGGSFLASERRVMCKCGKAICGDVKAFPKCPYCGEQQEAAKPIVVDADGDQMPDEWEKRFGLNPNDAADAALDKDGDGFTNLEECQAKTDPTDRNDHPDYLDSVKVQLPLKETYLPFVFTQANKIPSGWRLSFFDSAKKDSYGRKGTTVTATIGEEIGKYGFVLKGYEQKSAKKAIKGAGGLMRTVDVSEATIERKSDNKQIKLVIVQSKAAAKPVPVDVQATLSYERGTVRTIDVVPGSEIDLNGAKYRVVEIKAVGKGVKVTFEDKQGKKRTLDTLEQ